MVAFRVGSRSRSAETPFADGPPRSRELRGTGASFGCCIVGATTLGVALTTSGGESLERDTDISFPTTLMPTPFTLLLAPVALADAQEPARTIMQDTQIRLGLVPNMYAGLANAPVLLQTYVEGYDRFRSESGFTPAEQEVVFLSISRENGCDFCVAAHSYIADRKSKVPRAVTDAIWDGAVVPDAQLAALHQFTTELVRTRGRPSEASAAQFLAVGYSTVQILYLLLAISTKTISNYSNRLLETPLDAMFASRVFHRDPQA